MGEPVSVAEALLRLIPDDGTPVLNRILRISLARQLGRQIDHDEYISARNQLLQMQKIGVTRGQGGKVFLIAQNDIQPDAQPVETGWSEAALMPRLEDYLRTRFRDELDLPEASPVVVEDISRAGPRAGQWTRPDFVVVTLMKLRFIPQAHLDVHTFELKTESGGTVQAVHEALAQTRFSHFGHLVWHLPQASDYAVRLSEIEEQCKLHGIGFILIRDPLDFDSFEVRLEPVRRTTTATEIDGFLASRLTSDNQNELTEALA